MCYVTFKSGDGGVVNNGAMQTIDYGLFPNTGVTVMPKTGYSFAGWSYPEYTPLKGDMQPAAGGIMDYMSIEVLGDMVLTANFNLIPYTITYIMNGATEIHPQTYYVNSPEITLPTPERKGYNFIGWTGMELNDTTRNFTIPKKNFAIPIGLIGNRTYTANWDTIWTTCRFTISVSRRRVRDILLKDGRGMG